MPLFLTTESEVPVSVCLLSNWHDSAQEHHQSVCISVHQSVRPFNVFVYVPGYTYTTKPSILCKKYLYTFSDDMYMQLVLYIYLCVELCMKKQRRLARTIKRARHMGKYIIH